GGCEVQLNPSPKRWSRRHREKGKKILQDEARGHQKVAATNKLCKANARFTHTPSAVRMRCVLRCVCVAGAARAVVLSDMMRLQCATDPRLYNTNTAYLFIIFFISNPKVVTEHGLSTLQFV
ncbi:hypothetical protein, partial [Cetobacterium sp.]|uniref:hypothetical protein n=1 Tax=Cetobacterium sp. TaxID=2071632 RepID=UPI003EE43773